MRIRTGFLVSLAIGGVLIAGAVLSFGFNQAVVVEAVSENKEVDAVFTEGMQLVQLTNEVLLYAEPRAVSQWRSQFQKLETLTRHRDFRRDPVVEDHVRRIASNLADTLPLFEGLIAGRAAGRPTPPGEATAVLSSQLFRKSALLHTSLRGLKDLSEKELMQVHGSSKSRLLVTFGLFASITAVFGLMISFKFRNSVMRPIQDLGGAIERVNAGNAAERAPVGAEDEIGVVCRAFNGLLDQQQRNRDELQFLAYHDVLTGLPNQLLVEDRLDRAMAYAGRTDAKVALLFLDLDNFKAVNDTLGHPVGDRLLCEVARRLTDSVRESDTVGRMGGDEFIVVLADVRDAEDIAAAAHKLLERLSAPIAIDGYELTTSASIGIAICPDDSKAFEALLKKADTALYQAKGAGRNAYRFFTEQMNVASSDYLSMRTGLHRALETGALVLYYQPQIDLVTRAVVGAEALIRWRHPELGLVPPGRFIPVAEDSGLIVPIGQWVLREACRQSVEWTRQGLPPLVVAVNLSAVQFKRGDVEELVIDAIGESGIAPANLELELTESILIQDVEEILATVQRLKRLGVRLSIDDFGTGYSSLAYLRRFNVDKLKIDQSFIRGLERNGEDTAIVRTIIQLAHGLGLATVAEGVEDAVALEHLCALKCDQAQGYYFARPIPPDEFAAYLARNAGDVAQRTRAARGGYPATNVPKSAQTNDEQTTTGE